MWRNSPQFQGHWWPLGGVHFSLILVNRAIFKRILHRNWKEAIYGLFRNEPGYRLGKRDPIWAYSHSDSWPLNSGVSDKGQMTGVIISSPYNPQITAIASVILRMFGSNYFDTFIKFYQSNNVRYVVRFCKIPWFKWTCTIQPYCIVTKMLL